MKNLDVILARLEAIRDDRFAEMCKCKEVGDEVKEATLNGEVRGMITAINVIKNATR